MELPGYKIEKQIGKGGMAKVFLALHEGLDRKVAIKVMSKHLDEESGFSDRFMREARIVANLGHQHIVTVYDVGKHDGYHYIAMEYLPGGITLDHKIKQGIDARFALLTLRQMAAALGYAHGKGIIHRDVKPENIMYREDGSAVLTDFGIARSTTSTTKMTATGTVIGTPHYMSPEQAQGHEIGPYSDIYSLGVVFYEALTGEVPYDADSTIAVVFKHITEPIPALDAELAPYQPLVNKMMAKQKEDRYQDCAQIIADIDVLVHGGTPDPNATVINDGTLLNTAINPAISTKRTTQIKAVGSNKIIAAIVAMIVILAGGTGGYIYYQNDVDQQVQQEQALAEQQQAEQAKRLAEQKAEADKQKALAAQKTEQKKIETEKDNAAAQAERERLEAERKKKEQERVALLEAQKQKQQAERERKARERQQKIDRLLQDAETDVLNTRLNNAYKKYREVLAIDSGNSRANNGIQRVASQYLALANNVALKGEFDKANKYIESVIRIAPGHDQLASTQQAVFDLKNEHLARQAEQQRQAQEQNKTETSEPAEEEQKKRRSFGGF